MKLVYIGRCIKKLLKSHLIHLKRGGGKKIYNFMAPSPTDTTVIQNLVIKDWLDSS